MSDSIVNLPKTNFPMRGNLPQKEPETIKFWNDIDLYIIGFAHVRSVGWQYVRFFIY